MIRLFRHYVPRGLFALVIIEALILFGAVYLGIALAGVSYQYQNDHIPFFDAVAKFIAHPLAVSAVLPDAGALIVTMLGIMIAMGLYERNFWNGKTDVILRVGVSFIVGFFALTFLYYIIPMIRLDRREFGLTFSIAFVAILVARSIFLKASDQEKLKKRVLVLGAGNRALQLENSVSELEDSGFNIVGYMRMEHESPAIDPSKIISMPNDLSVFCDEQQIDEIIVALDDRRRGTLPMDSLLECKINGVRFIYPLAFIERETGKISLNDLQPSSMIFSDGFHQAVLKTTGKRLFDIAASSLILLLASPIILITIVSIWVESGFRGPIFYLQERVGRNERVFKVLKFRSMRVDAEKNGIQWAQKNDSRVTRVGGFIRRARIDELPQLINVLLGQMSFVGPRPERPQFVANLNKRVPYYSLRHRVNPGITGWAQLRYPYGASEADAREKLQYDLYYIKNYSLFLDFMVLLQTVQTILWAKGR
ncbi:MAG: TIGR03013 family XrtA/PEP-CTERM system glycosyltransferase [Gammaproteobacteria bacterium]